MTHVDAKRHYAECHDAIHLSVTKGTFTRPISEADFAQVSPLQRTELFKAIDITRQLNSKSDSGVNKPQGAVL